MFKYQFELGDGTPADPHAFTAVVPNWMAGDEMPLGAGRSLYVVEVRQEFSSSNRAEQHARSRPDRGQEQWPALP